MRLEAFFAIVALSSANETMVSRAVQQGDYIEFVNQHFGQDAPYGSQYSYFVGSNVFQDVDVAMAICDKVADILTWVPYYCSAFNIYVGADTRTTGDIKQWGTRDGWHSFLHTTRCGNGANATVITSPRGRPYKYCRNQDPVPVVQGNYSIPVQVCKQTCDLDTSCVAYASDLSSTCEIYHAGGCCDWDGYVPI